MIAIAVVFLVFCVLAMIMVAWTYYGNRDWLEAREPYPRWDRR